MFCKNCGKTLDEDALFCMNCGVKISDSILNKYCFNCGNSIEDDAIFCMKCGTRIPRDEDKFEKEREVVTEVIEKKDISVKKNAFALDSEDSMDTQKEMGAKENILESECSCEEKIVQSISEKSSSSDTGKEKDALNDEKKNRYTDIFLDGKHFVYLDDASKLLCPGCHCEVDPAVTLCSNCNSSFVISSTSTFSSCNNEVANDSNRVIGQEKSEQIKVTNSKKKIKRFVAIIISVVLVLIGTGIFFATQRQSTSPWSSDGECNLDALDYQYKLNGFTTNDYEIIEMFCYNISHKDVEKFWNSIPNKIVCFYRSWIPFTPEYSYISEYNSSFQSLMIKHNLCTSKILYTEGGVPYIYLYILNKDTGQLMSLYMEGML